MAAPLVSVVVPTYYRNDRLRDAVESVLASDYDAVEVVVVDDSGEAHAEPVAEEYPVEYVALPENRGGNPARMAGIERADGAYVQLLDDDDRLHPTKLSKQVALLEASNSDDEGAVGVAYCGMCFERGDDVLPNPDCRGDVLPQALAFDLSPCVTSTMLVDSDELAAVLPLANRPGGDDLGLMIDLARRTAFDYVDEVLVTRGEAGESRGKSRGVVRGRRDILWEYAHVYGLHPAPRRRAVAATNALEGRVRLGERAWDPRAIRAFLRAFRGEPSPERGAFLAASLFGRTGLTFADRVLSRVN
ncbi:glycosyltransferase family 2 protein [Halogeometricum limi]|uniref:Glycosyltransferase involved in cell wall bisynthesis n=1 Tax=Halogeometricum limi TaxID=555875 RepID=A0A1I6HUA0_9EURY|nr:glycosyltransferase [Halogeometricum limi]SFR57820.1 Glycosyltransferase involved in cell wall bisynthesis [Halogeometricum limi]